MIVNIVPVIVFLVKRMVGGEMRKDDVLGTSLLMSELGKKRGRHWSRL